MITLDGKDINEFGYKAQIAEEQELIVIPPIRQKTTTIPGMPGAWDFGSELDSRPINIALLELDDGEYGLQQKQNKLVEFLMDDFGNPRLIKLVYTFEPDKYIMVKIDDEIVSSLLGHLARFKTLPFIAHDPYKYLNVENHEINWDSTTATYDDTWSIDTVFVDDTLITSNQTVGTYVNGLALRPDIHLSGSGKDVTVSANGESFSLKDFTNDVFLIRGSDFSCFKNGVDNLTEMTGKHLTLLPGKNKIKITGSNMNFKLSIRMRDNYL